MKLPADFELHRYGIDVRLVTENDAEFILSLRTDEKLSRFIHSTDYDVEKQKQWIRDYKLREQNGTDYYFLYSFHNEAFAVNRIYDIREDHATSGSWVCKKGTDVNQSIATVLIVRDILFYSLCIQKDCFDVRKENLQVQRMHKRMMAVQVGETDLDYLYELDCANYEIGKNKIIKLLNITD